MRGGECETASKAKREKVVGKDREMRSEVRHRESGGELEWREIEGWEFE